ncbi:MAG: rod shape-determining protein MreC [Dehalococcoidia bacterium]|nr:rod shape-determining protein MreC [Dehalococcoidia bacterium]
MKRPWFVVSILAAGLLFSGFVSGAGPMASVEAAGVEAVSPLQEGMSLVSRIVSGFAESIRRIGYLEQENKSLKDDVVRLNNLMAQMQEVDLENQRLRAILEYQKNNPGREYAVATVIGRGQNNLTKSLVVNKGAHDSVRQGAVVVASNGLVGKVTQVYNNTSKITLLTDPSSAVDAIISRSRAEGVVVGIGSSELSMEFVRQDADIKAGDVVLTSGLGGGLPKNIVIGQVADVVSKDMYLFKDVNVRLAVPLESLEEVLVILDYNPAVSLDGVQSGR